MMEKSKVPRFVFVRAFFGAFFLNFYWIGIAAVFGGGSDPWEEAFFYSGIAFTIIPIIPFLSFLIAFSVERISKKYRIGIIATYLFIVIVLIYMLTLYYLPYSVGSVLVFCFYILLNLAAAFLMAFAMGCGTFFKIDKRE